MLRRFTAIAATFAATAAIIALAMLLGGNASAAPHAAAQMVGIKNFAFSPQTTTINVGDSVMWMNGDSTTHTVTAQDKSFDSGRLAKDGNFSFTFTKAGTYAYVCAIHDSMTGTIEVKDTGAAPAPAPAPAAAGAPSGALTAKDQPLVNGSLSVASITAGQDGWIVIHLDDQGKPGKVLGQTMVKAGTSKDVVVKLSEAVPAGGKVWPMLHIDAGAPGVYEFPGADVPVKDGDAIVMQQISITADAPAALPRTGGDDLSPWLALLALLPIAGGIALRRRRV